MSPCPSIGSKLIAPPPSILANPGQDSEPRPIVLQLTEDDDGGDLSDDRNCDTYPEQKENSASLPEYAGQSRAGYLANLLHGVEGSEATSLALRVLGRDVGYGRGPGGPEGSLAHVVHGASSSYAEKRGHRHIHHRRSDVGGRARGNPDQTPVAVGDPAVERSGDEEDRRRKAVDDPRLRCTQARVLCRQDREETVDHVGAGRDQHPDRGRAAEFSEKPEELLHPAAEKLHLRLGGERGLIRDRFLITDLTQAEPHPDRWQRGQGEDEDEQQFEAVSGGGDDQTRHAGTGHAADVLGAGVPAIDSSHSVVGIAGDGTERSNVPACGAGRLEEPHERQG